MRVLKLQMQLSIDGCVAGVEGEMNWMTWDWDEALKDYVKALTAPVNTIVMGHRTALGFIPHWQAYVNDPATADEFGQKMVDTTKLVFSRTPLLAEENLINGGWKNTAIAQSHLLDEITKLKQQSGGDIIVYGGAEFVAELIKANLIDEYHLFINPAIIGKGLRIFDRVSSSLPMQLQSAQKFDCGICVLNYKKS
jgi:dihydrofolate reductase